MSWIRDLRLAARLLRQAPAFALPAVASLAVGIAVTATMFTVVNAVLLRPLAAGASGAIVRIGRSMNGDHSFRSVSFEELEFVRRHAASFSEVVGAETAAVTIDGAGGPARLSAEIVTANYFRALALTPAPGRGFVETAADDRSAILSERSWRTRFGADPAIVGGTILVDNQPFTVVGVAPPRFAGLFPGVAADLWLPARRPGATAAVDPRAIDSMDAIGVLRPGVTQAAAAAELAVLSRRMHDAFPGRDRGRGLVAAAARGLHPALSRRIGPFVLGLFGLVIVVLGIACTNVASLLLARAHRRRGEFGVRLALGAGRRRVVEQLLAESSLLAALGTSAGLALSAWTIGTINALASAAGPTGVPIVLDLAIDRRVLAFTVSTMVATTVLFGLAPALHGSRLDVTAWLKDPEASPDRRRSGLRAALVVVQVAGAVVFLAAAGPFYRSVRNAARMDLGFNPDRVSVMSIDLQRLGYDRSRADLFFAELLRRSRELPGVERAALADFVPMAGRGGTLTLVHPRDGSDAGRITAPYNRVSDDYFAAIDLPLVRGREFGPSDRAALQPVAIVNETLARLLWPDTNPIGRSVRIVSESADPGTVHQIVGVARDARFLDFASPSGPFVFLPARNGFGRTQTLHVRSARDADAVRASLTVLVRGIDGTIVPGDSGTMRDAMAIALIPVRVAQVASAVASAIALVVAMGGVYGLLCFTLEQRLKEIAIRIALGARAADVVALVMGGTGRLTAIGVAIGLAVAAPALRVVSSLLIGVSPTDAATFAGVGALLAIVTAAAGFGVARRALRADTAALLRRG